MISVIITVYNKEKYLQKCLDSILAQTFRDFETIIVNDGSVDQSKYIINQYKQQCNDIRVYNNSNHGLSYSRDFGLSKALGSHFMFVDGDDYLAPDLLETLNQTVLCNPDVDVISFDINRVSEEGQKVGEIKKPSFVTLPGEEALVRFILGATTYATPWGYLYKKTYWDSYGFHFAQNRYHEDFGLTPLVIMKAKHVISLDYIGYHNVLSKDSIMRTDDKQKVLKRAYDFLYHFDVLAKEAGQTNIKKDTLDLFYVHIVHALIKKAMSLNKPERNAYIHQIRKRKVYLLLPTNNIKRKIKYMAVRINFKLYWHLYRFFSYFKK